MVQKLAELRATASIEGAARFVADSQGMENALRKLGGTAGESASEAAKAEHGFTRYGGALGRTVSFVDPAYRAQKRFNDGLVALTRSLDRGDIELAQYGVHLQQLGDRFEWNEGKITGFRRNLEGMGRSGGQAGFAMQQAGYQVGDFFVQVQSGQGILRPFIQQGTQIVQAFGPWGAVLGAAGAIAGALATSLWSTEEAGDAAKDALELLEEATEALNKESEKAVELDRQQAIGLLRKAEAAEAAARAELHELDVMLQKRQAELDATRASAFIEGTSAPAGFMQRDIDAARERMNAVGANADQARVTIQQLRDQMAGLGGDFVEQVAANESLIAAWGKSAREAAVVVKTAEILKGNYAGTKEQARALAETLVDQEATLAKLTKAQNDNVKSLEKEREQLERREKAGQAYIAGAEQEVEFLRLRVAGREDEIPLMEAEIRLREILARELLPEEKEQLKGIVAERELLKETIEAQEEAEKKAQKAAEEAARETQRVWERAGEGIQDAFADAIFESKDLFDSLKTVAKRTAAEIAAAFIFRPIISPLIMSAAGIGGGTALSGAAGGGFGGGGFSLSGLFGGGGFGDTSLASAASGGFGGITGLGTDFATSGIGQWLGLSQASPIGNVVTQSGASFVGGLSTAGSLLGAGGVGFGVGSLYGSLGLGNSTGSQVGGTIGGIAGSFLPIPGGTFIGSALGSIIGGMFGNDQPSNKFAATQIDLAGGTIGDARFNPSERSQATIDASQQMAQAFLGIAQQIEALTGGTGAEGAYVVAGERDGIQAYVGDANAGFGSPGQRTFRDPEDAVAWMVAEFAKSLTGVEDENFRKALAYGGTGEEILANLNFVQQLNALTDDGSMALVNALKAVNDQFDAAAEQATKLGIATGDLEEAREREIAATRAQFEATIAGLQGQADTAAQQYFAQTLDPLTQFRDSVLRRGELSNMSSRDQYLYAQSLFRGIDDTTSASEVVSLGQQYLTLAREHGASGALFTDAFREVNAVVSGLIDTREEEKRDFEALGITFATATADQTEELKEKIDELIDAVERAEKARAKASL